MRAPAPRRRSRWRPAAGIALAASCAVAGLTVLPGSLTRDGGTAFGQVPLLDTRPERVPPDLSESASLRAALGPGGVPTRAWPFETPDGTGWVVKGEGTWCLLIPVVRSQAQGSAVLCTKSLPMQRYGIAVHGGSRYVAAIPEGVRDPVLHHVDGSTTELYPDDLGIVIVANVEPGEQITRYGTDGTSATTTITGD